MLLKWKEEPTSLHRYPNLAVGVNALKIQQKLEFEMEGLYIYKVIYIVIECVEAMLSLYITNGIHAVLKDL